MNCYSTTLTIRHSTKSKKWEARILNLKLRIWILLCLNLWKPIPLFTTVKVFFDIITGSCINCSVLLIKLILLFTLFYSCHIFLAFLFFFYFDPYCSWISFRLSLRFFIALVDSTPDSSSLIAISSWANTSSSSFSADPIIFYLWHAMHHCYPTFIFLLSASLSLE